MAGKRRRRKTSTQASEIEMTPMIDVVFQLLIYFIVTITPIDISAHLDVFRPATSPPTDTKPPKMINIDIYAGNIITMNGRTVTMPTLTEYLRKLAAIDPKQTVMITCARDSRHNSLIEVLDRCAQTGMINLSVSSKN